LSLDWECFKRARDGDAPAGREVMDFCQGRILTLALLLTGSTAAADDIVQETIIRAFDGNIRHTDGTAEGYLVTIAYRLSLKETGRLKRNKDIEAIELPDPAGNPIEGLLNDERDRSIARAIWTLTDEHRDVLVLRFYGGHSYEEIAQILTIPVGTVKSRIFNAVKSVREQLRMKGIIE
jgi:RNA polymerase sigma-70 factor (ECF subfamily)